jgi:hypothetical protein
MLQDALSWKHKTQNGNEPGYQSTALKNGKGTTHP